MNFFRLKNGRCAGGYTNRFRLVPSLYRHPFLSFRWFWFTVYLDLNKIGPNPNIDKKPTWERKG